MATDTARTMPTGGRDSPLARSAQWTVVDGTPSHVKTGSSNPYGWRPCATARAKSPNAERHVSAVAVSVELDTDRRGRVPREVIVQRCTLGEVAASSTEATAPWAA